MRLLVLSILAALSLPSAVTAESYLCVEESSVGFNWVDGKWVQRTFTGSQYLIRKIGPNPSAATEQKCLDEIAMRGLATRPNPESPEESTYGCYSIGTIGTEYPSPGEVCTEWRDFDGAVSRVACEGWAGEYRFVPVGEFVVTQIYPAPIGADRETRDSLAISVGKCSKID